MNNWLHSAHVSKQQPRQEPKYSNTSTDVEKTPGKQAYILPSEKHLHGRGEDRWLGCPTLLRMETPPRTWRRHGNQGLQEQQEGNTSTDVEKTSVRCSTKLRPEKHLHGRGEDAHRLDFLDTRTETPPRTWRRLVKGVQKIAVLGNTSTDVEKTWQSGSSGTAGRKHLHGRGEDCEQWPSCLWQVETPPRTWRRPADYITTVADERNTSTDVEKTETKGILVGLC